MPSTSTARTYDVALSFAEEQRGVALALYLACQKADLKCYYHREAPEDIGKVITEEAKAIYGDRSRSVIMVLSETYGTRTYGVAEKQIILERKVTAGDNFLLFPLSVSDWMPEQAGLPKGTAYVRWLHNPVQIIEKIQGLLGAHKTSPETPQATFSVQADRIKNNITNPSIGGDLNIH